MVCGTRSILASSCRRDAMRHAQPPTDKLRTNVPAMLVAVLALLAIVYFGSVALAAQDILWFKRGFAVKPDRVVVYHAGKRSEYQPGQPGFDRLADAIQTSLDRGVSNPSSIGYSEQSFVDAYNLYTTVEAFYHQPVKLHAPFNTGAPDQMLFPMSGRHSDIALVLLAQNGRYQVDGPILNTVEPIRQAMKELGYLP